MAIAEFKFVDKIVQAQLLAPKGLLAKVHQPDPADVPDAPLSGAVSIPVVVGVTVAAPVEGTLTSNGYSSVEVTYTFVDQMSTYTWAHSKHRAISTSPTHLIKVAEKMGDALARVAIDQIVTLAIAATPGFSTVLPVGQINFISDGTQAENQEITTAILKCITFLTSTNQDISLNDMWSLCDNTALANIVGASNTQAHVDISDPITPLVGGVQVFALNGNTAIGGASEPAMYVGIRESISVAFGTPELTSDPEPTRGDGLHEMTVQAPFGHVTLRANGLSEILSPAT